MSSLKSLVMTTVNMPIKQLGLLVFIMLTAFLKSMTLSFLDIGIISNYLMTLGIVHLPFSYVFAAFALMLSGYYYLVFERRHGYGSIPVCLVAVLLLTGLTSWLHSTNFVNVNCAFWFNIGVFGILSGTFWSVAARFIPIKPDSRKFIAVLCAELVGFATAGNIVYFGNWQAQSVMVVSLIFLTLSVVCLKTLTYLSPVASETFVQKTGGAQDTSSFRLIYCILGYSFVYMLAKGFL